MVNKENARLRTRLLKTPVFAGDKLTRVGTTSDAAPLGEVYRLDSWEYPNTLYMVREDANKTEQGANLNGRQRFPLRDFGLEVFEYKRPPDNALKLARNYKRAGGSKDEYLKICETSLRASAKADGWRPAELAAALADSMMTAGKVWK